MPPFLLRPRAEDNPNTIRPYSWYDKYKDFWHDAANSDFPPIKLISGMMGTQHQPGAEGDSEDLQNQVLSSINPLEGPAAFATSTIVPREYIRKFADELAERTKIGFSSQGLDKTGEIVSNMIDKHHNIAGQLGHVLTESNPAYRGSFVKSDFAPYELGDLSRGKLITPNTKRISSATNSAYKNIAPILGGLHDEDRARRVLGAFGPYMNISGSMERMGNSDWENEVYKTTRHELSHANDWLNKVGTSDEGPHFDYRTPTYHTSLPETRARAVSQNFPRDMGNLRYNKSVLVPADDSSLKIIRIPFGNKILDEMDTGATNAANSGALNFARGSARAGELIKARQESEGVARHYFKPSRVAHFTNPGDVSFTIKDKPARLKPDSTFEPDLPEYLKGIFERIYSSPYWP